MKKNSALVLDIIEKSRSHLSAHDIYLQAKQVSPRIAPSTIYNNLASLVAQGAVRQLHQGSGPDLYDRAVPHDHLVCSRCGQLTDLFWEDMTPQWEALLGQSIEGYELTIKAICPQCRMKEG